MQLHMMWDFSSLSMFENEQRAASVLSRDVYWSILSSSRCLACRNLKISKSVLIAGSNLDLNSDVMLEYVSLTFLEASCGRTSLTNISWAAGPT